MLRFDRYNFDNTKSTTKNCTTRIVQRKLGKVPNNTESTTKISFVKKLAATAKVDTSLISQLYKHNKTWLEL